MLKSAIKFVGFFLYTVLCLVTGGAFGVVLFAIGLGAVDKEIADELVVTAREFVNQSSPEN